MLYSWKIWLALIVIVIGAFQYHRYRKKKRQSECFGFDQYDTVIPELDLDADGEPVDRLGLDKISKYI